MCNYLLYSNQIYLHFLLMITIDLIDPPFLAVDIVRRLPQLLNKENIDIFQEDFDDFRVTFMSELPSTELGLDNCWSHMSEVTDSFTDVTRFGVLPQLAKACLVFPTSNADSERTFSMLKKIRTDTRSELKITMYML